MVNIIMLSALYSLQLAVITFYSIESGLLTTYGLFGAGSSVTCVYVSINTSINTSMNSQDNQDSHDESREVSDHIEEKMIQDQCGVVTNKFKKNIKPKLKKKGQTGMIHSNNIIKS